MLFGGQVKKIILISLIVLSSCATYRPILNDNDQYSKVGEVQAERDIDDCLKKADIYLERHKSERMTKEATRGAGSGAALGAVVGLLSGGNLQSTVGGAAIGAGVGAASGAAGQATKDKWSPDELKQRYVQSCLHKKNYEVIGWK